jgi:cobalamin biosynthesis protein CobD/CbiB
MGKEKESGKAYPVKSLHDFLSELDEEWNKFRTGSLVGFVVSCVLLVFSGLSTLGALAEGKPLEFIFLVIISVFLVYTVFALYAQHRFFRRWERRIGLLLHLEESLIREKLGEESDSA